MYEDMFETQRRRLEERDRLMDAMVRETLASKTSYKSRVNSEHRIKDFLGRYLQVSAEFLGLHCDPQFRRARELATLPGPHDMTDFYTQLKRVRELHRDQPGDIAVPLALEFQTMLRDVGDPSRQEPDLVEFTDEEGYGRFLDLHECYDRYLNLKKMQRIEYIAYLKTFHRVDLIPASRKMSNEYRAYIECLVNYLVSIIRRVKPLLDIDATLNKAKQEFENKWAQGTFPGWPKVSSSSLSHAGAPLDLTPFKSAEELEVVGLDRLKSALTSLGLKCGGTLSERAKRLFSTVGKSLDSLDPSMFAKPSDKSAGHEKKERDRGREVAMLEAQLQHLADLVNDLRTATIENVERKQARTFDEYDEEEEEAVEEPQDEEFADDVPYNPKNLPLGWDGKPIPYWLYKLHGLNLSFSCEICGNQVYKGPKAFQKHFSEWRHAHGMRCLGIPNTAHFANVTKIADAVELWKELRERKEKHRFKPDVDEEFEDSHGNVVNRKTYDDLRRQGLL